jgi:hypothetical protein
MLIIGISGKIGTGKTELTKLLMERLGKGCARLAFGDALKRECAERYNFDLALCYSQEGKLKHLLHPDLPGGCMQVREILQWHGQKRRREHPGYWVGRWAALLQELPDDTTCLFVDDVRYPDEKNAVEHRHGFCVRLNPWPGWVPGPYAGHESETALDAYAWHEWAEHPTRTQDDLLLLADRVEKTAREWEETQGWGFVD